MKRCPTCDRTFPESNLAFCTEDGTPLINVDDVADDAEATIVSSPAAQGTSGSRSRATEEQSGDRQDWNTPAYQPPGQFPPAPPEPPRTAWPWVLGTVAVILLALIGLGIAAAIFVPDIMKARQARNQNRAIVSDNTRPNENSNQDLNSNGNSNENKNANSNSAVNTATPENQEEVLADLRNIENEWTVANLTADKQKLERILADDYVGVQQGVMQGKADYLRDIKPDPTVKHWDFRNLKVVLNGNRATLTGIVRLASSDQDEELMLSFTDKFVWRDGRWQAVASEVSPVR